MPEPLKIGLVSDLNPDVIFYPGSNGAQQNIPSVHPCLTLSELGIKMDALGVAKPSSFGNMVDAWISRGWIHLNDQIVTPGKHVLENLDDAGSLHQKLVELNRMKEESSLKPETVKKIITS